MIKIKHVAIKGYEFTGSINISDLNLGQLDKLNINPETHSTDEIDVSGDFGVSCSYDESEIDSLDVTLHGMNGATLTLDPNEYDENDLVSEILSQDNGEWYRDQQEAAAEHQMESWKNGDYD